MKKAVVRRQVGNEKGRGKDERLFPLLPALKIHLFPAKTHAALRRLKGTVKRDGASSSRGPSLPIVIGNQDDGCPKWEATAFGYLIHPPSLPERR